MAKSKVEVMGTEVAIIKPAVGGKFAKFAAIDDATAGSDLINFVLALGSNKCRIITDPIMIRKHWDLPQSSNKKGAVPCAKHVTDYDAYAADPEEYLISLGKCPYCDFHAQDPKFYGVKEHWVFNVVQDGEVKVAEFYQGSILRAISEFENDPDWIKVMKGGGIETLEINIKKESTGPKPQNVKYSVSGVPGSEPLHPDQMEEYRSVMMDIVALKIPPAMNTPEGKEYWDALLAECGAPKLGEKPKGFNS